MDLALCYKGFILKMTGDSKSGRSLLDSLKFQFKIDDNFAKLFILKIDYDI
jgi:hypothetical protein